MNYSELPTAQIQKMAEDGDKRACRELSKRYSTGTVLLKKDPSMAEYWLDRANKTTQSQQIENRDYSDLPTVKIQKLAASGDKIACRELSKRYSTGTAILEQNDQLADYWMKKSRGESENRSSNHTVGVSNGTITEISHKTSIYTIADKSREDEEKEIDKKYINMSVNKNIEWVIGIDLGHGETSAAICPMQWDTPEGQLEPPKDLEMGSNRKVIPSVMTIMPNGDAFIGDSAFKHDNLEGAQSFAYFKKKPVNVDGDNERVMIRFMHEVYKYIFEKNSDKLTKDNHIVAIATPSGWDKNAQNIYMEMARKAGLPIEFVTKESRAAFVRAQHDATSGLSRSLDKGAIVFDMGSSTLDFTFLNRSKSNELIDHGYNCGASYVEKMMFNRLEQDTPIIKEFEHKYPKLTSTLLYETREVKENIYFDPSSKVKKFINFEEFVDDEDFEDERFKIKYEPGQLDSELLADGYIGQIADAMTDFQKNYLHGAKIYGVLMTGGASRMDFIKDLIAKYWDVDPSQIYRDQDPSLTISQGVAEVARIDMLTSGVDRGLSDEFNKFRDGNLIADKFMEEFEEYLTSQVTDSVGGTITSFRDVDEDYSLNDLQSSISNNITETIDNCTSNLSEVVQEVAAEETKDLRQKVENVIAYYSSQGIKASVPEFQVSSVEIEGLSMDELMNAISSQISEESDGWTTAITGAAIGLGTAFLLGGPLGWIAGGGYLLYKSLFGESEEEKKEKAMTKELDKDQRGQVFNSLSQDWDNITEKISDSIHSSLSENIGIRNSVKKVASSLVKQYERQLKDARILID